MNSPRLATVLILALADCGYLVAQESSRKESPTSPAQVIAKAVAGKAIHDPQVARAVAASLEDVYRGTPLPEAVKMVVGVLRGSGMGPGDGWFGPAQTRFTWRRLAERCGVDPTQGAIRREQFTGGASFLILDRDRDGAITPDDLDWSDNHPWVLASNLALRLFRKLDRQGDGQLTEDELLRFFAQARQEKDHLSSNDLRDALLAGLPNARRSDPRRMPTIVRGILDGDLGSLHEGPKLNDPAPDFTLRTFDESRIVQLSKMIGPKPIVLVFGSFT